MDARFRANPEASTHQILPIQNVVLHWWGGKARAMMDGGAHSEFTNGESVMSNYPTLITPGGASTMGGKRDQTSWSD